MKKKSAPLNMGKNEVLRDEGKRLSPGGANLRMCIRLSVKWSGAD